MKPASTSELRALENRLIRPETRRSRAEMDELLDDEFREVGASGETYTKAQVLAALSEEPDTSFELDGFHAVALGRDAALATFRVTKRAADKKPVTSLRASVWVKRGGRWRLLFHQGTLL